MDTVLLGEGRGTSIIPVDHVQQKFTWDCGIACVLMVLSEPERKHFLEHEQEILDEQGFGISVWTIDLAYLLKKFNVPCIYATITLGVDPTYVKENFYNKNFDDVTKRVQQRFENAEKHSVIIENRVVSLEEILQHLCTLEPVIVLINGNLLKCETCTPRLVFPPNLISTDINNGDIPYQGHFITLCGYELINSKIFYRNPSCSNKICCTTFNNFESARHSYGTDDDVVFIRPQH